MLIYNNLFFAFLMLFLSFCLVVAFISMRRNLPLNAAFKTLLDHLKKFWYWINNLEPSELYPTHLGDSSRYIAKLFYDFNAIYRVYYYERGIAYDNIYLYCFRAESLKVTLDALELLELQEALAAKILTQHFENCGYTPPPELSCTSLIAVQNPGNLIQIGFARNPEGVQYLENIRLNERKHIHDAMVQPSSTTIQTTWEDEK